jgi:hypothetical protein
MTVNKYVVTVAGQEQLSRLIGMPIKVRLVESVDHFYTDGAAVGAIYAVNLNDGPTFYLDAGGGPHFGVPAEFYPLSVQIQEFILNSEEPS